MNLASFSVKVIAASLLIASTSGLAFAKNYKGDYNYKGEVEPCPPPPMLRDGFYVGGQVGYDSYRIHHEASIVTPAGFPFAAATGISASSSGSATGWVGGLFIGYGRYLTDVFYLGGELQGNYSGAKSTTRFTFDDTFSTRGRVRARGTWGISLVPGLRLNNASLGYVRLSYDWTRFKANESVYITPLTAPTLIASGENSSRRGGWNFGVGIETLLCDTWSVRTEYDHIWYRSFDRNFTTVEGIVGSGDVKVSDNQFTVGLVYHFV